MKNSYKLALLAALGLLSVTAAQAQNDLILGIYNPAAANTYTLDLGLGANGSLGTDLPANGQSWDISTALARAGVSSGTTGVSFGVVGDDKDLSLTAPNGDYVFVTTTSLPGTLTGTGAWNALDNAVASMVIGSDTAGDAYSWKGEMDVNTSTGAAAQIGSNIGGLTTSALNLYTITANGSAPVLDGTFTLNQANDTLTFNAVSVPEPATFGLLAGAGLLIVSLRNKLGRK